MAHASNGAPVERQCPGEINTAKTRVTPVIQSITIIQWYKICYVLYIHYCLAIYIYLGSDEVSVSDEVKAAPVARRSLAQKLNLY